jgi:5-methyltetrahydropteroyltriglutamate--homocysteine methyltransferase
LYDLDELFPASVVGSYPQPDWLVDREKLRSKPPPRSSAKDIWRVSGQFLERAQDDATLLAIREMESTGIDVVTDGEIRRESYSNRFATALEGMDIDNPGISTGRSGRKVEVPRVVGPIRWKGPVLLRDAEFLVRNATRTTKVTIPGPFTIAQQTQNDYYSDQASMAVDAAVAVNMEAKALKSTGVDVIQLDEPYLQVAPERAREYGIEVINRALEGVEGTTTVHTCFGYGYMIKDKPNGYPFLGELVDCKAKQLSIEAAQPKLDLAVLESLAEKEVVLGSIDLGDPSVETPGMVADRIREALRHVPAERLAVAPDCGMKYLDRTVAFEKLRALVQGAQLMRSELEGSRRA